MMHPRSLIPLLGLGTLGYILFRGFSKELDRYVPDVGPIGTRFDGPIAVVHTQLIGAIDMIRGAFVYSDEGHTVMISTVPAVRIEGSFGLFVRAELRQLQGVQTSVTWTAMAKTPWASSRNLKQRSLVQLERDVRDMMKTHHGAQEVM